MILTTSAETHLEPFPHYNQIQPNGIDCCVENIQTFNKGTYTLTNDNKEYLELIDLKTTQDDFWVLPQGEYLVTYQEKIAMPPGECGFIYPRSYLLFNGASLHSGIIDSGFGWVSPEKIDPQPLKNLLIVHTGYFKVKKGTRLGQLIITKSEKGGKLYDGERFNIDREA